MDIWGWGRKNTADVNEKGQLKTYAEVSSTDYDAAHEGDAFRMDINGITAGGDGFWLFVLKNGHATKEMVVTRIYLVPNGSSDDQELEVYVGGSITSRAEGTDVTPTNMKAGLIGGAQGIFYVADGLGDTIATVVTGLIAGRIGMISKGRIYDFRTQSGWHIPPDQCIMAMVAKSDKFRGFVSFYYK